VREEIDVYWRGDVLENNTRGTLFIVTRAAIAIALHLLYTIHLAPLQLVWVLTTCVTYSTKYRRSSYAPGFTYKQKQTQRKPKQQRSNKENPKLPSFHRLNKGELNNNHVQAGLDLGFHGLVLWGWFSCIMQISEVFNMNQA
jgi:hypothetical protein